MICCGEPISWGPPAIASSIVRNGVLYPALPSRCGLKLCRTFAVVQLLVPGDRVLGVSAMEEARRNRPPRARGRDRARHSS
ncbi:hypothetical protein STANM309S_04830 [Streptomyces tanashiensis]